jgi:hypothetical protein
LKKCTLWKVAKETIIIENEKLFSCVKSRSKSLNPRFCMRKKNIMHLPKRKKVKAKRNSRMSRSLDPCHRRCYSNIEFTRIKLISKIWKDNFDRGFNRNID